MTDSCGTLSASLSSLRDASGDEGVPFWMQEMSGQVTSLASYQVEIRNHWHSKSEGEQAIDSPPDSKNHTRVVVGLMDGSVWIFGAMDAVEKLTEKAENNVGIDTVSSGSYLYRDERPQSPTSLISPTSPTRSATPNIHLGSSKAPPSIGLLSSPSYLTDLATKRHRRTSLASLTPSISSIRKPDHGTTGRGKGNATVSVNSSTISLPPHPITPPPGQRAPSPVVNSSTKSPSLDQLPSLIVSSVLKEPPPRKTNGHSHNGSFTIGSGLWNGATPLYATPSSDTSEEKTEDTEEPVEHLDKVIPLFKIRTGGKGKVSQLVVNAGKLLVLRADGLVTAHSLIDGLELDSVHAGSGVLVPGNAANLVFENLEILETPMGTFGLCYGSPEVGLILIDLDNWTIYQENPLKHLLAPRIGILYKQNMHFIVSCEAGYLPSGSGLDLHVQPIVPPRIASPPPPESSAKPGLAKVIENMYVGAPHLIGRLDGLGGVIRGFKNWREDMLLFTGCGLALFTIRDQHVCLLGLLSGLDNVVDVFIGRDECLVVQNNSCSWFSILPLLDDTNSFEFVKIHELPNTRVEHAYFLTSILKSRRTNPLSDPENGSYFLISATVETSRVLQVLSRPLPATPSMETADTVSANDRTLLPITTRNLFMSTISPLAGGRVTCVEQSDLEGVLLGFSNGTISFVLYDELDLARPISSNAVIRGSITVFKKDRIGDMPVLIAGSLDGNLGVWDIRSWKNIAMWSILATPVLHIISTPSGYLALGPTSVVVFSLSPPKVHFLIPGSRSPVEQVAIKGDELLIVYESGNGRLWDRRDGGLRRAMDLRTVKGLLEDPEWLVLYAGLKRKIQRSVETTFAGDPVLSINIRAVIENTVALLPWNVVPRTRGDGLTPIMTMKSKSNTPYSFISPSKPTHSRNISSTSSTRSIEQPRKKDRITSQELWKQMGLARFLIRRSVGQDPTVQGVLREMGIYTGERIEMGVWMQNASLTLCTRPISKEQWTVSPQMTARKLMEVVSLLRIYLHFSDTEHLSSRAVLHYATLIGDSVGERFQYPSLDGFIRYWLDANDDIRESARILFGSYLGNMADGAILDLVRDKENQLGHDETLLLLGLVASQKYNLLTPQVIARIAQCTNDALYSLDSHMQVIGAELCLHGWEVWMTSLDADQVVKQLIGLAVGRNGPTKHPASGSNSLVFAFTSKKGSSLRSLGAAEIEVRHAAKQAILHVAGASGSLFMTTMLYELTVESGRDAVMMLLGYLVQQKPLVICNNLTRITESIVRTLDPSQSTNTRETASAILTQLVKTYPCMDYHGKSHRLAVGTPTGHTLVYDLRTASRIWTLLSHRRATSGVSFSPDGRRLVSVCLGEKKAVNWKVTVGIGGMLAGLVGVVEGVGVSYSGTAHQQSGVIKDGEVPVELLEGGVLDLRMEWQTERRVIIHSNLQNVSIDV